MLVLSLPYLMQLLMKSFEILYYFIVLIETSRLESFQYFNIKFRLFYEQSALSTPEKVTKICLTKRYCPVVGIHSSYSEVPVSNLGHEKPDNMRQIFLLFLQSFDSESAILSKITPY